VPIQINDQMIKLKICFKKLFMENKTKPILMLCMCLMFSQVSRSQEDNKKISLTDSTNSNNTISHVEVVRLKRSYQLGDGLTFRSSVGNLNIGQSLQTVYGVSSANKDLSAMSSQFAINRARMTLVGNIFDNKVGLNIRLNFPVNNQSTVTGTRSFNNVLQEAYVEYNPNSSHSFNFGLRADYIDNRETRIEGENLGFINRSAISDAFNAIFDYGLRYKGNYRLGRRGLLRPYLSLTTGDGRASLQKNFGGFNYGARLDYLPFGKFTSGGEFYMDDIARESKPKLVIGGVFSFNDGISSATGTNGGRYIYGDADQHQVMPDYKKWVVDYLFKYHGFYSLGSYVHTNVNIPANIAGEFSLSGRFTPYNGQSSQQIEKTVRSRLNLGSGFHVQAGYILPSDWAFALRYAKLNNASDAAAFADQDRHYTFVATKYLSGNNLKIQTEFGFDQLKQSLQTDTQAGNYYAQIMLTLQL
jgi:phosphate-selective porin OprO/OprP